LLRCDRIRDFITQHRDDGTQLWVFHHLAKTAGTSFVAAAGSQLLPAGNVHVPREIIASGPFNLEAELDNAFRKFWQEKTDTAFRFVSGHLRRRHIERIRTLKHARVVTILRDPFDRVLSQYHYSQTPVNPAYLSFRSKFPTFESYFELPAHRNRMAMLLAGPGASAEQCKEILLHDYLVCGTVEMYPQFCALMGELLGIKVAVRRENASTHDVANYVAEADVHRNRFLALNTIDVDIYRFVQEAWAKKRQEVEDRCGFAPLRG
jgi:hypothetical protein